ncbi:MAG: ferredoxin [Cyanobacteria bacterium HKST-UBA06]|nr:ferredoxin [Cyanobacteria bacterium HKST-UBA05]MCA9798427.1 ferredoxin [Cyanobacteria bacterium HKST-UBA04]MCA9806821.1 ferredoxin [Cyanobacteria bacterium HKST-UBA06]
MHIDIVEGCIACGVCESLCPEVFTVTDTSHACQAGVSGREDACRQAAEACPVSVIVVKES